MAWSGGTFRKGNYSTNGWTGDASLGIGIEAGRHDTQDDDFANGINQCLNKDGTNAATGNLNLGGFIPTNIAAGSAAAPAICVGADIDTGVFGPAADTWAVATNGSERLRVDSTGRVGVALSNPDSPLNVLAATGNAVAASLRGRSADNISVALFTQNNGTEVARIQADVTSLQINKTGNNPIVYSTNGAERFRITGAGRVGVNTGTPNAFMQLVNSESAALNTLNVQSNLVGDVATHALIVGKADNNSTTTQRFIGFFINASGVGSGQINANGASAAAFGSFSDERLKENIVDLPSQLSSILALRPVEFDYKDGSGHQLGFIAQEVEQVFPDLVGNSDGYLTLTDMNKNDARLIKAFQELHAKVEALEARVAALEA